MKRLLLNKNQFLELEPFRKLTTRLRSYEVSNREFYDKQFCEAIESKREVYLKDPSCEIHVCKYENGNGFTINIVHTNCVEAQIYANYPNVSLDTFKQIYKDCCGRECCISD